MFKFSLLILFLLLISLKVISQKKQEKQKTPFKIVGYYLLNAGLEDSLYSDSAYLFLDKITHLNIAFINPDSTGNFKQDLAIHTLIKKAHRKNVKVLASIAGGGPHPYYSLLLRDDKRTYFIKNLIALVERYDLDGIDVDLEGSDIDTNYQNFVTELAASLKPLNKLVTAAIATAYKDQLPDKALKQFDFVNVMSYDRTGPWRPDNPGHHSPYTMSVEDIDYWHKTRLIPKEKLVLGLPFYGYGFGNSNTPAISMDYKEVSAINKNNQTQDTLALPGSVLFYYKSISTIQKKTELAMKEASGVMIWQLSGDIVGENSLLNTIYLAAKKVPLQHKK